jgi:hypothetical protein
MLGRDMHADKHLCAIMTIGAMHPAAIHNQKMFFEKAVFFSFYIDIRLSIELI